MKIDWEVVLLTNSPLYVRLSPALSPWGGSFVNLIDICQINWEQENITTSGTSQNLEDEELKQLSSGSTV